MSKAILVTAVIVIVAIASFAVADEITKRGENSANPFLALTANMTDPSPQANFTYGYASPNLWNLQKGDGNVTMQIFSNSSIHTKAHLSNLTQGVPVMAYSSIHFTYQIPMPLSTVESDNFSSYASFGIKYKSAGAFNDFGYDFFLGQGTNLQYEVMILLNITSDGFVTRYSVPIVTIPIIINGKAQNIQWYVSPIESLTQGVSGAVQFAPVHTLNTSMTCLLSFVPFVSYLETHNIISPSWSIVRIGIGSEYGTQSSDFIDYSFWMYSYFIIDGTDYQIVQLPSQ